MRAAQVTCGDPSIGAASLRPQVGWLDEELPNLPASRLPARFPDLAPAGWPSEGDAALVGGASGPDASEPPWPHSTPAEDIFPAIGQYVGLHDARLAPEAFGDAEGFLPELPGFRPPSPGFPVADADAELSGSRQELLLDVGQELLAQGRRLGQGTGV